MWNVSTQGKQILCPHHPRQSQVLSKPSFLQEILAAPRGPLPWRGQYFKQEGAGLYWSFQRSQNMFGGVQVQPPSQDLTWNYFRNRSSGRKFLLPCLLQQNRFAFQLALKHAGWPGLKLAGIYSKGRTRGENPSIYILHLCWEWANRTVGSQSNL